MSPISKRSLLWFVLLGMIVTSDFAAAVQEFETRAFTTEVTLQIPARGTRPTRRTATAELTVPAGWEVIREPAETHGATMEHLNRDSMHVRQESFAAIDQGVRLTWELENRHPAPLNGRRATVTLQLKARRAIMAAPQPPPPGPAPAQPTAQLHRNYLKFRDRFTSDFYYDGMVAEAITADGATIAFADQTIYLGMALLAFATEEAVCIKYGQDPEPARKIVRQLLTAAEQLDAAAEPALGLEAQAANGFFLRDNITGPTDPRLNNRFPQVKSDYQSIAAGTDNYSPSGDQIFGLLVGLHAVVDFSTDQDSQARARQLARQLYDYAARTGFVLKMPNGSDTRRGSDMRFMASLLHGVQRAITGEEMWNSAQLSGLPNLGGLIPNPRRQDLAKRALTSFWNSRQSIDWLNGLIGERVELPVVLREALGLRRDPELNSFSLHMLFMATASDLGVWSPEDQQAAALKANHHVAVLLNARRSGRLTVELSPTQIEAILDACPDTGPSGQNSAESGWAQDNRWIRCTKAYRENTSSDRFNGLDWLILHNLSRLR